jgi:hypothetical protein
MVPQWEILFQNDETKEAFQREDYFVEGSIIAGIEFCFEIIA